MRNIIYLFTRFQTVIVFIILEIVALSFVFKSNNYQEVKFLNTSNVISGNILNISNAFFNFIYASKNNKAIMAENVKLRAQLVYQNHYKVDTLLPKKSESYSYNYIPAKVVNNSINNNNNYITLNKGTTDGIQKGFGVVSSNGIVGIVVNTTPNFSLVMSIISTKSNIGVKHLKTNSIGSMFWTGNNPFVLNVDNFSKTLPIKINDTIVTSGYSSIFPPDLPVAIVKRLEPNPTSSFYICDVKLTNSIVSLTDVYVVVNKNIKELEQLNQAINNE